ncbi:MAG: hypothetical protein HQL66_00605 [Magnetococcales bacterium]|nr:hypothetical protein [Magnetococcales bacterium]
MRLDPAAEKVLRDRVARHGLRAVAEGLGCSKPLVVALSKGQYGASTVKWSDRIMRLWGDLYCAYLRRRIAVAECRDYFAEQPDPRDVTASGLWVACRDCPHAAALEEPPERLPALPKF